MKSLISIVLSISIAMSQVACVSTGPKALNRADANHLKVGEEITITLKDQRKIRSHFRGSDKSGVMTDQGLFLHDDIQKLEVERFSAGETVVRTAGFVYVLVVAAAFVFGKMLDDALDDND